MNEEDPTGCTGVARKTRAPKFPVPETYFNTLWAGIEAWYNYLFAIGEQKGFGVPERPLSECNIQALCSGESLRLTIPYVEGKGSRAVYISVYKRDEGVKVYEVTAYNA